MSTGRLDFRDIKDAVEDRCNDRGMKERDFSGHERCRRGRLPPS